MYKTILFIDQAAPKAYSALTLQTEALGGTEATVVRVAEELTLYGNKVHIYQQARTQSWYSSNGVHYVASLKDIKPDIVVSLRRTETAERAVKAYKDAKHYLWLHDWASPELAEEASTLAWGNVTLICVSKTHQSRTELYLAERSALKMPVTYIYNPVEDDLYSMPRLEVDKNKLVFFSSPHKGLKETLEIFNDLPSSLTLHVTNPGYYPDGNFEKKDNVIVHGPLPHRQNLEHVRNALCVFYPNTVFSETFGLVLAEANAVGTPVIAHDFGAAREVLGNSEQLVNCLDKEAVIARVLAYQKYRPKLTGKPEFKLSHVASKWKELLHL